MRKLLFLSIAIALAACGSSTEPGKGADPSLLITNDLQNDYVFVTWQDGNAIIGKDSVAPRTSNQCVRFTAQPDSAKWIITAGEVLNGAPRSTSTLGGAWFNPSDRPAWDVIVTSAAPFSGSPKILAWDSTAAVSGPVDGASRPVPSPC